MHSGKKPQKISKESIIPEKKNISLVTLHSEKNLVVKPHGFIKKLLQFKCGESCGLKESE